MKFRISTVLILLGIFVSAAQAQSNCCQIQLGGVQISGANGSVAPSASGPGGTYVATQTETYPSRASIQIPLNPVTRQACPITWLRRPEQARMLTVTLLLATLPSRQPLPNQALHREPPPALRIKATVTLASMVAEPAFRKIPNRLLLAPAL